MTLGELKTAIREYLGNRQDISDSRIDQIVNFVDVRVAADVRATEQSETVSVSIDSTGAGDRPAGMLEVIAFQRPDKQMLRPVSLEDLYKYEDGSGKALVYSFDDDKFRVRPKSAGTYVLWYWKKFADRTNDAQTVPREAIYLAGCMQQASLLIHNADLAAVWEAQYQELVRQVNKRARNEMPIGVSSRYIYNTHGVAL